MRDTGAFTLPTGSRDAALIPTLAPGAYTTQVGAADGTSTGIASARGAGRSAVDFSP